MKTKLTLAILLLATATSWNTIAPKWRIDRNENFILFYTDSDADQKSAHKKLIVDGIIAVNQFFDSGFKKQFKVYVHPSRHSLDSTWRKDWKMPDFKSECWMVASGVATKLDWLSPKVWDQHACEHVYADTQKTQQLITHELVHVFHGQRNASPDFSQTEGIDWFVEGLATYASGQCDANRLSEVKKALQENKIPNSLDDFWSGKIKYGLSGSMVMYIERKYGREKLIGLLPYSKKSEILAALHTSEAELLADWKRFIQILP
ncbi:hypothetical protein [Flavobacterium sp.]|uniref:hypothetical protein n=1 Tax=Flavobacterium sp. TaxID=239 RepID=UPI0039E316A8